DGVLYVADWTDPGVGGDATGDNDLATISGRTYRIVPPGNTPAPPALDLSTVKGQIEALCSPNVSRRYVGYQELAAGGADAFADKVQPLATVVDLASKDFAEQEQARQERVVAKWYLEAFGIACQGREKEVLEAWQKTGKTKDPKVSEALTWRLNR